MPVLHGERMGSYGAIMREAAERELARWPRHDSVIIRPGMTRIALEVICRRLFGRADDGQLQHHVERFLDAAQTPTLFMARTLIPRTRLRVLLQRRTDVSLPSACSRQSRAPRCGVRWPIAVEQAHRPHLQRQGTKAGRGRIDGSRQSVCG